VAGGALTATIARAALYRGGLTGTIGVAPAARGISVTPRLTATGLELGAILRAAGATDRLQGTLNASANLTGSGATPEAIRNSLSGSARTEMRNGAIRGLNIANALRNFNPAGLGRAFNNAETTDFGEMSASWALRSGVASTSDLRLASPLLRLDGAGSYSIHGQSVDFNVCAKLVASIQGQGAGDKAGLSAPWRIHGPVANLSYVPRVDPKCLASNLEGLKNLKPEDLKKLKPEDIRRILPFPGRK
jgi:AsmA protein